MSEYQPVLEYRLHAVKKGKLVKRKVCDMLWSVLDVITDCDEYEKAVQNVVQLLESECDNGKHEFDAVQIHNATVGNPDSRSFVAEFTMSDIEIYDIIYGSDEIEIMWINLIKKMSDAIAKYEGAQK